MPRDVRRWVVAPETRDMGHCELFHMSPGNTTQVFWKSHLISYVLSHQASPKNNDFGPVGYNASSVAGERTKRPNWYSEWTGPMKQHRALFNFIFTLLSLLAQCLFVVVAVVITSICVCWKHFAVESMRNLLQFNLELDEESVLWVLCWGKKEERLGALVFWKLVLGTKAFTCQS